MALLFGCSLFLSATLLFLLQPLVGKMLLPYYGGSSAVWNTCLVFFQALLLAGYSYAHAAPAVLGKRRHVVLHFVLLAAAAAVLPIAVPAATAPPPGVDPTLSLLAALFLVVGLPFFVISTTAPLVQHWFAATGHTSGRDPYFLYAASNAGSMVGLLAYPFVLEPLVGLRWQAIGWAAGYGLLVVLLAACGLIVWRARPTLTVTGERATRPAEPVAPSWRTRLRWVALAFVPSSLLLGVTAYLSMDVAPMPLLWVLPLAVYLLSFILVFGPMRTRGLYLFRRVLPLVVLAQVGFLIVRPRLPLQYQIAANLLTLFVAAMVCHGELARTRPASRHLTEYYLWLSLGGALGGAFSALAAPLLFAGTYEYPLGLVLLCLLTTRLDGASLLAAKPAAPQPGGKHTQRGPTGGIAAEKRRGRGTRQARSGTAPRGRTIPSWRNFGALVGPVAAGVLELLAACILVMKVPFWPPLYASLVVLLALSLWAKVVRIRGPADATQWPGWDLVLDLAIPAALAFVAVWGLRGAALEISFLLYPFLGLSLYGRPVRLGLGIAVLLAVGLWAHDHRENVVYRHRNFYGALRIWGKYTLYHGQTLHGSQDHSDEALVARAFLAVNTFSAIGEAQCRLAALAGSAPYFLSVAEVALIVPRDELKVPRWYYYPTGPAGDVFRALVQGHDGCRVGIIGLGTGSLAAYGEKGQHFAFFEIDPTVIELACDSSYFTYLRESAAECEVVAGDARLMLRVRPPGSFDVLVIDAFSGDSVPTHLLTREALRLYRDLLAPGGAVLFHISNQYFDLEPLLGNLAAAEGMVGLGRIDHPTRKERNKVKNESHWALLARSEEDIAALKQPRALFKLTGKTLVSLRAVGAPAAVMSRLTALEEKSRPDPPQDRPEFLEDLAETLKSQELQPLQDLILKSSEVRVVRWHTVRTRPGLVPWTDDFSSLLSVLGLPKEAITADP
jgi:SAM-dependent methyltransferase